MHQTLCYLALQNTIIINVINGPIWRPKIRPPPTPVSCYPIASCPSSSPTEPGLVAYITCGDPSLEVSRDVALAAIDAGADVIELGVPFSDPVADGPVIQRASERALAQGTDLAGVIDVARQIRQHSKAGLIIFSYLNPILQFGLDKFCQAAKNAGVDGALVTDLPVEEAADYLRAMKAHKLAPVFWPRPPAPTSA